MSYYRPIRVEELVAWLIEKDYNMTTAAIGVLAADLIDAFDLLFESHTAA